jgi:hypothetical protein
LEDNKDKMDTARRNMQKKLKRQELMQQQKHEQMKKMGGDQGNNTSGNGGGGGGVKIKGSKGKGTGEALSLDKIWIELQWLKRNKLDIAEYMRLRKGVAGGNNNESIQETTDGKKENKKGGKKGVESGGNSILQNIAMHFKYELSKADSAEGFGSVSRAGGANYTDYYIEDAVRDLKIAMVDTAAGIKDLRERVTALEENRKIDVA